MVKKYVKVRGKTRLVEVLPSGMWRFLKHTGKKVDLSYKMNQIPFKTGRVKRRSGASNVAKRKSKSFSRGGMKRYFTPAVRIGGGVLGALGANEVSKRVPEFGPRMAFVTGASVALFAPAKIPGLREAGAGAAIIGGYLAARDMLAQSQGAGGASVSGGTVR